MQLLFVDGVSHHDPNNIGIKFATAGPGVQNLSLPGRFSGRSVQMFNTGFDSFTQTKVLAASHHRLTIGFAFRPLDTSSFTTIVDTVFLRFQNGSAMQLSVRLKPTGRLQFFTGGSGTNASPGTLLDSPAYVFTYGQWVYVELDVTFGSHGSIELRIDDSQVYLATNINVGTADPDRFAIYFEAFGFIGINYGDMYLTDGGFLGPCRVSTYFPTSDRSLSLFTRNTGATDVSAVDDNFPAGPFPPPTPDGDLGYIAGSSGARDLFGFDTVPCFGRNLAVAVNACVRSTSGTGQVNFWSRPDPTQTTVVNLGFSELLAASSSYRTVQTVLPASLLTAGFWTDREIEAAEWGVGVITGNMRVTQFFLEKLTSLRNVSYDCGRLGSYAL